MPNVTEMHIGIDDTDSPHGMCTTYFGAILHTLFVKKGFRRLDYPYLVRLNPNVPFKTRGNGAVSLHFLVPSERLGWVCRILIRLLDALVEKHGKTKPAIVIVSKVSRELSVLYRKALVDVIPFSRAERLAAKLRERGELLWHWYKGRGLVGALAAVGAYPLKLYTYELLLYREVFNRSPKRPVALNEVIELDRRTRPLTFANVDYEKRRVLVSPHGPDPVIAGIRSFDSKILEKIAPKLKELWSASLWVIYKTNQGLNMHLRMNACSGEVRPYQSVRILGTVASEPWVHRGGHVFFKLRGSSGTVLCAVFKETGKLNTVARLLRKGDLIEVMGGVSPPSNGVLTVNVEALRVLRLVPEIVKAYPRCPVCGGRLSSAGRGKGVKCKRCGYRSMTITPAIRKRPRVLEPGTYLQSPRAYRHLSVTHRCVTYAGCLGNLVHHVLTLGPGSILGQ